MYLFRKSMTIYNSITFWWDLGLGKAGTGDWNRADEISTTERAEEGTLIVVEDDRE